jgi:hypothetical protein
MNILYAVGSRDSAVSIATGYGLNGWGIGVQIPVVSKIFSLHVVQTDPGANPVSYPMGVGGFFPAGKAAGAWSWPLISN